MAELSQEQVMRLIMQAVPDAARRAVATQVKRLGFVTASQVAGVDTVSVRVDGDDVATSILNATGLPLTEGQRVVVDFYPPHGALVSGIVKVPRQPVRMLQIIPAANRDVTSATMVNWTTETAVIAAPAWATRALVTTHSSGWYDPTVNGVAINITTMVDGVDGSPVVLSLPSLDRRAASWANEYNVTPGANIVIRPRARRSSGTGTLRADTSTRFQYVVEWLPPT